MSVYIRESLTEAEEAKYPEALPMVKAIAKMRDEVTGVLMLRYRGHSRELSMVLAKLDEARLWAIAEGEKRMSLVIVDRAEVIREVTDTTVTTVDNGNERVTADV